MSVRYAGLSAISIPGGDERYVSEAACLARCDELTAAIAARRAEKVADQARYGPSHENMLTSWDDCSYIPSVSLGRDYWSPRLVRGKHRHLTKGDER